MAKYRCLICAYIYDEKREGVFFDDLFPDWTCPVCGAGKSEFERLEDEPPPPAPAEPVRERKSIEDFRRASDELETHMADIHHGDRIKFSPRFCDSTPPPERSHMPESPQRLFLIDGSGYIYRAYFAIRHLSNSKGQATNAVYGFVNMLLKVVREQQPDHLAVIFDSKGPTFRHQLYPEYKANRAAMPDDLVPQVPVIKAVVRAFNMPAIELAGFEADDIIATLAKRFAADGLAVTVVTGDKDLMQVVTERISLLDTMKNQVSGLQGCGNGWAIL